MLSSRIEGTQTTLEEVLRYEATTEAPEGKLADIEEVINYRRAMQCAVVRMKERPLSLNLIREIHGILLEGVRGRDKARGEFRRTQNYIAKPGAPIEAAIYVPPVPEHVKEFLYNWEEYIHAEERDLLTQLAIIHAQFEVIHLFLDGNGRVGRILIPLFLFEKDLLNWPVFYTSAYLEAHRDEYYHHLSLVSEARDWESWITFFLTAVAEQARDNITKAQAVFDLYDDLKIEFIKLTHSQYAVQTLDTMFMNPVFNTSYFIKESGIPRRTALRILSAAKAEKYLIVVQGSAGRRGEALAFHSLLALIR